MSSSQFRFLALLAIFLITGGIFYWLTKESGIRDVSFSVKYPNSMETFYSAKEGVSLEQVLKEKGYMVTENTKVFPPKEAPLSAGTMVTLIPEIPFILEDAEGKREYVKPVTTVEEVLLETNTTLEGADFVEPSLETKIASEDKVTVTRVTVTEETEDEKISFKKKEVEDDTLSWQTKKVSQKGENGVLTTKYKVSRHNGEVVAKEKIEESVTKEPQDEITVIGTKVTVVRKHNGLASWYAHTGTLSAANPWLPIGSYARVTNEANGKSVIVRINDRGPFGPGRIIDLDKVAFQKIADLGTGVISVKMEEIK